MCFYQEETWEEMKSDDFELEARRCAEESVMKLCDPSSSESSRMRGGEGSVGLKIVVSWDLF